MMNYFDICYCAVCKLCTAEIHMGWTANCYFSTTKSVFDNKKYQPS